MLGERGGREREGVRRERERGRERGERGGLGEREVGREREGVR